MNRTLATMQDGLLMNVEDVLSKHERNGTSNQMSITDIISCKSLQAVIKSITGDDQTDQGESNMSKDSIVHIVDLAKAIASGEQAQLNDPNDKEILRLGSVFSHLNIPDGQIHLSTDCEDYRVESSAQVDNDSSNGFRKLLNRWMKMCDNYVFDTSHSNALIDSIEACFSDVPSSQNSLAERGVSMFHQSKATAAMACCIERWLKQKDIQDCRKALVENRSTFMKEKVFLLYSLDLSGIQTFIYTISNKGALKGLRVRSFYLSIMMESIADMILEACGLFRTNLIYSGGGRAHLLLPNDDQCFGHAEETVALVNQFFMEHFGTSLFLARGYAEVSANELSSEKGEDRTISDLFRTASAEISRQKLQRYNAKEIIALNEKKDSHSTERECVICGQSGRLKPHGDGEMICETCDALEKFSNTLTQDSFFLAVYRTKVDNSLPLPGGMWLARINDTVLQNESIATDDNIVRIYSINGEFAPLPKTIQLRMGNYQAVNEDATSMTFEQLANASKGVKRLGVLRADVDNLGALFATGLIDPDDEHPYRYATLPRYMALSAALTNFFQQEINRIVGEANETWLPDGEVSKQRNVSIVYSGGDDVFLIGAWNEVLDAGIALQNAFRRYTGGRVTLSAGFGMFPQHEPVGIMAQATANLEEEAKMIADGTKNAISLFGSVGGDSSFTFHWHDFQHTVLKEKVSLLNRLYFNRGDDEQRTGNAFLYQVLSLLREVQKEPIAIARLAYLLARHTPDKKRVTDEQAELYNEFSRNVYKWAMEPEENKALQAAVLLHVYAHRKEQDSDVQ